MGLVGKNWGTLSIDASGLSGRSPFSLLEVAP
jgi:hypothetical protein